MSLTDDALEQVEKLFRENAELRKERDAAYRERAHLVALLAAQHPSHIGHTDPAAPDWAVLTVELPTGQACWHIAPADMDLFGHVQPSPFYARGWDGHSADEKYRRIAELTRDVHQAAIDPTPPAEQAERDADVRRGVAALLDAVETFRAWLTDAYDPDAPAPDPATAMYQRAAELRARIAALAVLDARTTDGGAT